MVLPAQRADYEFTEGTGSKARRDQKEFSVGIIDDIFEEDEHFFVRLSKRSHGGGAARGGDVSQSTQ